MVQNRKTKKPLKKTVTTKTNKKTKVKTSSPKKVSSTSLFLKNIILFLSNIFIKIKSIPTFLIKFILTIIFLIKRFLMIFIMNIKTLLVRTYISITVGILSGGLSAAIIYTILDNNKVGSTTPSYINSIESRISLLEEDKIILEEIKSKISNINTKISNSIEKQFELTNSKDENIKIISELDQKISSLSININKIITKQNTIQNLVNKNSRLMTNSSDSELSNRLQLASNLVERLISGVPYYPTLSALGPDAAEPALLRFAKGGAPTYADLSARLAGRAGEVRDADKTNRDVSWRENLTDQITNIIKIKPLNIEKAKGVNGALLRAEMAITNGKLSKAIKEINSLDPKIRGPLSAWLSEANARQNADIAAQNILAKATAAIGNKN